MGPKTIQMFFVLPLFSVSRTKMSAAAVASSVLASGSNDEDRKLWETDIQNNGFLNLPNNKDLETVLVFTLEDDNEISVLGLLTEQQVDDVTFSLFGNVR